MKRRRLAAALMGCGMCLSLLAAPAGAHSMALDGITIMPNEETQQFWNTYKYPLNDQMIYEHSADNWSFCAEFNDGLLLVQDGVNPPPLTGYWDNYVDKNGVLHNLNQGRYFSMYSFSGGLAAVVKNVTSPSSGGNLGYVDTNGNEVIPCNEEWYQFQYGGITPFFAGRFENGRAVVLRSPELPDYGYYNGVYYDHPTDTTSYDTANPDRWYGIEYAYIDTKGNYLTDWILTDDINTVLSLPLYDQDGIRLYDRVYGLGSSNGLPEPEIPEKPFTPEYHAPGLPEYNQQAPSLFASTAKVTGFSVGMADLGGIDVTVTNPTDVTDAGVVALAAMNEKGASGRAGVFFIPYEVAPGSSQTYSVSTRDIIHEGIFGGTWSNSSSNSALLEEYVEMSIITFTDAADMQAFYDTIPYEQYWYPSSLPNEFQPVCDGAPGSAWLKGTLGFHREYEYEYFYYQFPNGESAYSGEVDHSICEK